MSALLLSSSKIDTKSKNHLTQFYNWLANNLPRSNYQERSETEVEEQIKRVGYVAITFVKQSIKGILTFHSHNDWSDFLKNSQSKSTNNISFHHHRGKPYQIDRTDIVHCATKTDNTAKNEETRNAKESSHQSSSSSTSSEFSESDNLIEDLRNQLKEANSRANQSESNEKSLEREVKELQNKNKNLERNYTDLENNHKFEMGQVMGKNSSDEKYYNQQIQAAKKKYEERISNLENQLDASEQQKNDQQRDNQRQFTKLETKVRYLESEYKSLEDKFKKSDNCVHELEDELRTVIADKNKIQTDCNYWQTQYRLGLETAKKLVTRQGASKYAEESSMQIYVSIPRNFEDVVSSILVELGYDKCHTVVSSPEEVPDSAKLHLYFSFLSTNRVTDDIINGFKSFQGKSINQLFVPISCAANPKKITERELRKEWKLNQNATMPQVLFNRKDKTVRKESLGDLRSNINQVFGLQDVADSSSQESLADVLAKLR